MLLANVRFLAGYRHADRVDAALADAIRGGLPEAASIGELEAALAGPGGRGPRGRAAPGVAGRVPRGPVGAAVGRDAAGACRVSRPRPAVAAITTGTRLVYDGEAWTVAGIEASG